MTTHNNTNREIKFRAWDNTALIMFKWTDVQNNPNGITDPKQYDLTLMQYTGLKDKHGKEIYEGDIVAIRFHEAPDGEVFENGVIKWDEDSSGFKWFSGDDSDWHNYWLTHSDHLGREVLGNIYESPELLKENK